MVDLSTRCGLETARFGNDPSHLDRVSSDPARCLRPDPDAYAPHHVPRASDVVEAGTQIVAGTPMSAAVPQILRDLGLLEPGWNPLAPTVARDAAADFKEPEWKGRCWPTETCLRDSDNLTCGDLAQKLQGKSGRTM